MLCLFGSTFKSIQSTACHRLQHFTMEIMGNCTRWLTLSGVRQQSGKNSWLSYLKTTLTIIGFIFQLSTQV